MFDDLNIAFYISENNELGTTIQDNPFGEESNIIIRYFLNNLC
jgi:hypothetical protein